MRTRATDATSTGRYSWELLFSLANEENEHVNTLIKREIEVITRRSIDSRRFVSNIFSIQSGFSFRQETSASLTFKGVPIGTTSEFSTHLEVANEITRTFETQTTVEEENSDRQTYEVGPGDTINVYQLVYAFEGAIVRTGILATQPRDDIEVELTFGVEERIVGLNAILDELQSVRPGRDNKGEWANIRSAIVSARDKSYVEAFRSLVEVLSETKPRRDNKREWADIRQTCHEILEAWETTEKHLLLRKLLSRFMTTHPGRDNKREWSGIRRTSNEILQELRQVF
ncbi:MAG: hypothetical protein AAGI70_01815 [Pseudomonadota bacterium]